VAVLDLNAHLAPAGLFIESAGPDGAPTADDTKRLYTLVNTRTDEVAAQTARWELWEQKAFVQIYHTLRKPYVPCLPALLLLCFTCVSLQCTPRCTSLKAPETCQGR